MSDNSINMREFLFHRILNLLQAKLQELAEHVPKGHIPRSMTVHFRGELTRKVGDLCCLLSVFQKLHKIDAYLHAVGR